MADLRIVDSPLIPKVDITGLEKIPTGGSGNYSISLDGVADYAKESLDLANKTDVQTSENGVKALLKQHTDNLSNPHVVTKSQVGLDNVDNTADVDKPMSNTVQAAITTLTNSKADKTEVYLKTETYNKSEVDSALSNKPNSNTVYTKIQTDTLLNGRVSSVNGKTGTSITLTRNDLGISSDEVMQQWTKEARFVQDESGMNQQQFNDKTVGTVESITDLLGITNPKSGQVVFVKSIEKNYTYTPDTTEVENGVTVVSKWVMEVPEAYYASWFATPNILVNQTPQLQIGYDYATSKKKAFIVDEKFNVDPEVANGLKVGLFVRSKSCLIFKKGLGKIKLMPNASEGYDIVRIEDVEDFLIFDLDIEGDKSEHLGTTGEWGYGLTIYQCKNGYIRSPYVSNTWGDGIYIGKRWGVLTDLVPLNITIDYPIVDGAGRNGISLTCGENVIINTPVVKNTKGKAPEAGIDIEPEEAGGALSRLSNCKIHNATLIDNVSPINIFASKAGRRIEVNFTGVTTFKNSNASSADQFYVYKRAVMAGQSQSGLVYFERLLWDSQRTNLIFGLESPKTGFKIEIETLELMGNANSVSFNWQGTALIGQPYGDFTINKLSNSGINTSMSKFFMENSTDLEIESPINHATNLNQFYDDPAHYVKYAPKSFGDIEHKWVGFSQNTRVMPNVVWVDPSVAPSDFITMYTGDDFRVMKIGLFSDTAIVGGGCSVNGLSLLIDGVAKTTANTKTLGGWIKFQNVSGGRTRIFDQYGVWTFS